MNGSRSFTPLHGTRFLTLADVDTFHFLTSSVADIKYLRNLRSLLPLEVVPVFKQAIIE